MRNTTEHRVRPVAFGTDSQGFLGQITHNVNKPLTEKRFKSVFFTTKFRTHRAQTDGCGENFGIRRVMDDSADHSRNIWRVNRQAFPAY